MSFAEKMTAIGDAIRNKTGKTDKLSLDEMATEINEISTGERDINPEWTDWSYFCQYKDDLAAKLKYSDTSNGTNFSYMFRYCKSITSAPVIDTSKGTNFSGMLYECSNLISLPALNTSKGFNFSNMFKYCGKLTSIPEIDTSNGTQITSMFHGCEKLQSIPKLDISKATAVSSIFANCNSLVNLNIVGTINITGLTVQSCNLLSHDSLMSIINALADKTGVSGTRKVILGATNLAKLTAEEIAIAEGKGWTLA